MTKIPFTKMHGLGNDFVIINTHDLPLLPSDLPVAHLAHRNLGIGFDQLLVVTPKQNLEEFFCEIFNADGSRAEQCGNGLRCVARYVQEEGLCTAANFIISTIAGSYAINIKDYDHITVNMGTPMIKSKAYKAKTIENLTYSVIEIGNPHAIINAEQAFETTPEGLAKELSASGHFPNGMNVGFIEVIDKNSARLRTFERGAGETLACGSNACAAAIVGIENHWLNSPVTIQFAYGSLTINWAGEGHNVTMTGPAARVFSGEADLTLK